MLTWSSSLAICSSGAHAVHIEDLYKVQDERERLRTQQYNVLHVSPDADTCPDREGASRNIRMLHRVLITILHR